jgi:biopolymer transport protein ExbB
MMKYSGRGFAACTGNVARSLVVILGLGLLGFGPPAGTAARAQATGDGPAATTTQGADRGGARGTGGADDPGTAPGGAADGQGGSSRLDPNGSILSWAYRASGPIGLVIAVMSFYLITLVVWMALNYRASVAVPGEVVNEVQGLLERSKFNEAYQLLLEDTSFLARVLAAGVRKLGAGLVPAHRAMELANEDVTMEMEHRTTYLATVGTLGPMIGLVGTVYGMILAFRVIAMEGSSPQASQLAEGISTALFATLEGIALSIPAIYFYALFRNRIARLSLEVGMTAEALLEQFAPGIRMSPPSSGPVTGPVPAPNPQSHAHPFAVSAALAAASGQGPRPALPPSDPAPHRVE